MVNFSLQDIGMIMRAVFEQQGNGDISEIPQALVMLGSATAMAASAGANQAPPRMLAGQEQVYLVILSVVFAWGLATIWAGIWAYFDPRVRGDVGKKMLFATLVVLFVASVGLGAEVNLNI